MRRFLLGFALGLAAPVGALVGLGHYLAVEDPLVRADAIVAISGDTGARTETAVALWREGVAPLIIFAGASLDPASAPSGELMKREAVRRGVPEDRVLVEGASATTSENAERVSDLLHERRIRSAVLVTSPYHQRRAAILFSRQLAGTDVTFRNYPARDPQWDINLWWAREPSRPLTLLEVTKLGVELAGGLRPR